MVVSRSFDSILREAEKFVTHPGFKGIIQDVGGASANMYGMGCQKMAISGPCRDKRCLIPAACRMLNTSHRSQVELLRALREISGIRKVFVSSGIRHDLVLQDREHGCAYLSEIIRHHVSGQLKIAPEHFNDRILALMGKPSFSMAQRFVRLYRDENRRQARRQYLSCYLIAAHPGCTIDDMKRLKHEAKRLFGFLPRQVQIFTPTPSTISTLMYYTERDLDWNSIYVEKALKKKRLQKEVFTGKQGD